MASVADWRSSEGPQTPLRFMSRPSASSPRTPQPTQALDEGRRIYVGNMPYMAKPEDVEKLFEGGAFTVERIDMSVDPFTGRNPSYCFVELASKEQAELAMSEINGRDLLGRPVKVNVCIQRGQSQRNTPTGTPRSASKQTPVFDRWARRDEAPQHWEYSEQGKRLYVGGLPKPESQQASDEEIRALFDGFKIEAISKVISAPDTTGTRTGNYYYAFVDLSSAEEADAAAQALNEKEAYGGMLKVKKAINRNSKKVDERSKFNAGQDGSASAASSESPAPKPQRPREWETKTSWR